MSLLVSVSDGESSLDDIGQNLGDYGDNRISKQAVQQRLKQSAVDFMEATTAAVLADRYASNHILKSSLFKRILIEDASLVQMHATNCKDFRSFGNKKGATAAYKIDFCYDLLSGKPVTASRVEAYANDKKAGTKFVDSYLREGDLCMRDMGYYKLADLLEIERKQAYWLSKIPTNVNIDYNGENLNKLLKTTRLNKLDIEVALAKGKMKCRLVAVRAKPEDAAQKRREANKQARNHGKTPRKDASLRNGWHILVSNISKDQMGSSDLASLYRVRWQIETNFKAWKQSTQLNKCFNKKSNAFHLQCLIQASIILLLLTMRSVIELQPRSKKWISIRKVARKLTKYLLRQRSMSELELFDPDLRSVSMEARDRENLMQIACSCLT